jgi:tripeptide aminopeptidase
VTPAVGDDGVIRSTGETILGADNKSAVAATMRACAFVAGLDRAARPTVIAAFTCREEAGQMGVSLLDLGREADCAFSVDGSAPIGTVITRALGQQVFTVLIRGRAAHAAADPGAGVSAIAVASEAIAAMGLGRLPGGGSASIAAVVGGAVVDRLGGIDGGADAVFAALEATPTNSVPDVCMLRGEVRGYSEDELRRSRQALQDAVAAACDAHGASYEWHDRERAVPPFPGAAQSRALRLARAACARVPGAEFRVDEAHATLEANYLAATTDVVALASGGRHAHQFSESISVAELEALEALLCAIVSEAAGA